MNRDSTVSMETYYLLDGLGVEIRVPNFRPDQPPIEWVQGAISLWGKAAGA
jgi:hypothetical protein